MFAASLPWKMLQLCFINLSLFGLLGTLFFYRFACFFFGDFLIVFYVARGGVLGRSCFLRPCY